MENYSALVSLAKQALGPLAEQVLGEQHDGEVGGMCVL